MQGEWQYYRSSPQNPTGTTFKKETLEAICDLVIEENTRRGDGQKKLYVLYDQMYWQLTYGAIEHYNPVTLRPAMRDYTIFIDAISNTISYIARTGSYILFLYILTLLILKIGAYFGIVQYGFQENKSILYITLFSVVMLLFSFIRSI